MWTVEHITHTHTHIHTNTSICFRSFNWKMVEFARHATWFCKYIQEYLLPEIDRVQCMGSSSTCTAGQGCFFVIINFKMVAVHFRLLVCTPHNLRLRFYFRFFSSSFIAFVFHRTGQSYGYAPHNSKLSYAFQRQFRLFVTGMPIVDTIAVRSEMWWQCRDIGNLTRATLYVTTYVNFKQSAWAVCDCVCVSVSVYVWRIPLFPL